MASSTAAAASGLRRSEHELLLVGGDTLIAAIALAMALWVWSFTTGFPFGIGFVTERAAWLVAVPIWVWVVAPTRTWPAAQTLDRTVRGLLSAAGVLLALYAVLYFYATPAALARLPVLYFVWEAVLLTAGWRLIYLFVLGQGAFTRKLIVVGDGARAAAAVDLMTHAARDAVVVGTVSGREQSSGPPMSAVPLTTLDRLLEQGVVEIVLALEEPPSAALTERLLRLQERGLEVVPFAAEYEQRLERVPIDYLDPDWAFTSLPEWVRARDASRLAKRLLDIAGGLLGIVILAVLAIPVSIAVWLGSGRPIFYRQQRLGRGGRRFDVLKFRTMVVGAEADGAQWAAADDRRVTPVGRWLRRSRLDEWPQVINVVRGEMSLVGPRPERPEFAERLGAEIPFYRTRLLVSPGLTGWAQVNADYGDSVEGQARKLEYDLYYIKHRSLFFDVWILLQTVGTVLGLRGR